MATDVDTLDELAPDSLTGPSAAEHRRVLVIIGALMLGTLLATLDQTIVATALPTISADLHGLNHLSWVVTAYLLTSTISMPLWGKLGDLYGRKKLFQAAIVIFLVGSAMAGLSRSMAELVAFRAVQGVGAGGLMVGAQAIMGDVISPRQRGRYMGYFGAVYGITNVAGPLLGGVFTQDLSWRWVFYINLPIGVIALFVIAGVLHVPVKRTAHTIDYTGTALLAAAVTVLVLLTTWGGTTYPWLSGQIIGMAVLAAALVVAFCVVERRAAEPLLPLGLFRIRVFTVSSLVAFLVGFILFGAVIFLPLYLQTVHRASPTSSGLQLLPMVFGMLITLISSGRLVSRWGRYKVFPVVGTAVTTIGLALLSLLTPTTSMAASSLYMFVIGLGIGSVMQILVVAVQNAVPYDQLGTATSATTFFRSIGGSFGVAFLGAIFDGRLLGALGRFLPPSVYRHLAGQNVSSNPAQIAALPWAIRHGYVLAFSHSLHDVFLISVPFAAVGFALTWLLKEAPLRDRAFVSTASDPPDAAGHHSAIRVPVR